MDRSPSIQGDIWDADANTADVDQASASTGGTVDPLGTPVAGGSRSDVLSDAEMAHLTGMSRDAASLRNVTVLPFVESSGERVALKPRNEARYQHVRPLGAGAMGEVDLVRDNDIGRTVARKQLARRALSPDGIARFIEEIRTVGRLEHPNIVPIHDVGIDETGQIFFVMKHVDGETLESIIRKLSDGDAEYQRRYTIDARIELFLGLLRALQFAHAQGIVHRGRSLPSKGTISWFPKFRTATRGRGTRASDWCRSRSARGHATPPVSATPAAISKGSGAPFGPSPCALSASISRRVKAVLHMAGR